MNPVYKLFLLFCILSSVSVLTKLQDMPEAIYPKLAVHAATPNDFIPKGWKLEQMKKGDLNGDGKADIALVLHQNDPRNVVRNELVLGAAQYDTNPRILAVALADPRGQGYTLVLENHSLIPILDQPTIDDPFKSVSILNGSLRVSLRFWSSVGSYSAYETTYTFRYSTDCFRLIGYDNTDMQRNSGQTTEYSVNYLTGKIKTTTSIYGSRRKLVKFSNLSSIKQICIDLITDSFDPEHP